LASDEFSQAKANIDSAVTDFNAGLINNDVLEAVKIANSYTSDYEKRRVGLGIQDLRGLYLSAIYENQKSIGFVETINGKTNNADVWQGQISYAFSNSMIKGMYG